MQSFSLTQVVPEATHINPNGTATLIDLALVSTPSLLQSCTIIPPIGNSDHNGFLLHLNWKSSSQQVRSQPRTIWRYDHADFGKACELINSTDWDALIVDNDVSLSLQNWEQCFLQIMDVCIPKGTLPKRQNLPWLSKNLLRAMRKRNRLYKRAKRSGAPVHMTRNKVVMMLRTDKKLFFNNLNAANNKQFWKTMKYLRKEQSSVPVLSHAGCTANNDKDKASMLNNFFSQCFNKELPPLTSHDCLGFTTPDECPESVLCSEEEVAQLLQSIDVSKSNGPDKISGRMLKVTALSIAPSITKLFNLSIKLGCVPQTWKLSNVVPIPCRVR